MITLLQRPTVPLAKRQTGAGTAARRLAPSGSRTDFQKLMQPATQGAASSPAAGTSQTSVAGTGQTSAAIPAAKAQPPASTPIPIPPITDVHDHAQVEAHMNAWLENVTQHGNDQKMQVYQQAMTDWQTNCQQCQNLGLPLPPQPAPPTLDPVQPMPTGWWFLT